MAVRELAACVALVVAQEFDAKAALFDVRGSAEFQDFGAEAVPTSIGARACAYALKGSNEWDQSNEAEPL